METAPAMTHRWQRCFDRSTRKIFKVHLKNLFFTYLVVFFCCNVGESECVLKARCRLLCGLYKNSVLVSENEAILRKYLCVVHLSNTSKKLRYHSRSIISLEKL